MDSRSAGGTGTARRLQLAFVYAGVVQYHPLETEPRLDARDTPPWRDDGPSCGRGSRRGSASASASLLAGETSVPVIADSISSEFPPTRVAMTGSPVAIASRIVLKHPRPATAGRSSRVRAMIRGRPHARLRTRRASAIPARSSTCCASPATRHPRQRSISFAARQPDPAPGLGRRRAVRFSGSLMPSIRPTVPMSHRPGSPNGQPGIAGRPPRDGRKRSVSTPL